MNPADLLTQSNGETKVRLGGFLLPAEDFSMANFMRFRLGMAWLHPGGITSTEYLLNMLRITPGMRILDLGCGLGTTTDMLARRYGCEVVGIDHDPSMIAGAMSKKTYSKHVVFKNMDGTAMEFDANTFDCVILQSVLCFNDKEKLLREIFRVLKPGGQLGINESTWMQPPTPETAIVTRATICETFCHALETNDWISILLDTRFTNIKHKTYEFTSMSPYQMLREEGFFNTLRVMIKVILNPELNMRLGAVSTYFSTFHGYFGYGLYTGTKSDC